MGNSRRIGGGIGSSPQSSDALPYALGDARSLDASIFASGDTIYLDDFLPYKLVSGDSKFLVVRSSQD